jgi:cobalt-zinc-cadmium efflux system membrane fusion protein
MASLTINPVVATVFRAERVTDGKIALDGDRTTPVFPPFTGRVTRILAKPGDRVERGAPLLAIEAPDFVQAQNDYVSAQAALDTARSQLTLAQVSEQRKHALYDAKAGALQDWQQSQAELVAAQSALRAAQTALALAHNRLRILGASEGQLHSLEQAQKVEALATVTAPIAGVITDRQVGLGQYLQAGASTPVFSIGDLSRVWLVANVREADAPLMHRGAQVEVRVLALPERVFKATITYVAPSIDPNTHRLAVRAEVSNPDELLKPEMFATFTILTGREATAPGVPEQAVVYEGEHARVWVARAD